ncbi:MAG: crossover junction endodeoxyribonuclease RuvC [Planctomycetota bacterium]|jgi:crossover junction endodeoxyribonuclease RuvC
MATFTGRDITLGIVAVVRILGIDPGTQVVGFGCLEVATTSPPDGASSANRVPLAMRGSNVIRAGSANSGGVRLVRAGVFKLGGRTVDLTQRLLSLSKQFADLVTELGPSDLAIEEAFFGKSVQSALRIGEARGVLLAESARYGLDVFQYTPARVKRCVTGHGAARKQQVAKMLGQMLPPGEVPFPGDLTEDATDAVAVAWTRLEEMRSPLAATQNHSNARRTRGFAND